MWPILAWVLLASPSVLLAQQTEVLPPAQSLPPDSMADVSTLAPAEELAAPSTIPVKPFLVPDPQGLQQWQDLIEQYPELVPPAPGFVEDKE